MQDSKKPSCGFLDTFFLQCVSEFSSVVLLYLIFSPHFLVCVFVSDPQGLGRWEEEGLSQTLGLLWEHRPAQGGQFLSWFYGPNTKPKMLFCVVNKCLIWALYSSYHSTHNICLYSSICLHYSVYLSVSRLPNCVSSFSAANAAAAIGGIKTASPRSMAATPSSSRRWSIESVKECVCVSDRK